MAVNNGTGAQDGPYVIHGRGKDKAPADAFSLFADINYNDGGTRDKILVIPAKGTANNFSDYGFDQSDDGVSAVVNNTTIDNILFTRTNQGGSQLPVKAGTSIDDMTAIPLSGSATGTWNDQAQSALAFAKPVPPPVFTAPTAGAPTEKRRQPVQGTAASDVQKVLLYEGAKLLSTCPVTDSKWEYTPDADWSLGQQDLTAVAERDEVTSGKAYLRFYVTLPSPVVDIRSPLNGAEVDTAASIDGVAFHAESVNLNEGGTKIGSAKVNGQNWSFTHEGEWSTGSHTVTAKAVGGGGQESDPDTVTFTAAKKNLTVEQKFNTSWLDGETQKYIYSYDITMYAGESAVTHWNVGFGQLPVGSVLYKEFAGTFWGMIIDDGSNGDVLLGSPPEGVHMVPQGGNLPIRVLVLYPTQEDAHKQLYGLFAKSLSK
ncbi:Ig-like domain-containing protein [Streptomyces sp. NPDC087420]|uniref:Ig-like domain-containing protein n=1 Tax=Streptomyces sp. NPDC087420 TaxID=3365785 RepID=UPI003838581A